MTIETDKQGDESQLQGMTEITITYKRFTIKESLIKLLSQEEHSRHLEKWFKVIDRWVELGATPATITGTDLVDGMVLLKGEK